VSRISGRHDLDFPLRYVTMLPPLLGAVTALALYWLAHGLGAGRLASLLTAGSGALTTLLLKYATLLYSHIAGALFVTAALAAVLLAERRPGQVWPLILGGALLGWSGVAEYPNLLPIVPVGLYVL
jgi:4-amino-4-deoxy-L-arabinose transferase-like glycosyltransferase